MDGLDKFAQDPQSGLLVPIISRRQVLPYDDVDALGWGSTPAQISPDLLSAFAVLVGQSGQQGKLINATKFGALQATSQVNYTARAANAAIVGATTIQVDDPVFGSSDVPIQIFPGPGNPNPTHGPYFGSARADPHFLDLSAGLLIQVQPGDVVMAMPQVQIFGSTSQVHLLTKLIQTAIGVTNPFDSEIMGTTTINGHRRLAVDPARSVDDSKVVVNASPGIGTLTFPALGAGFRIVVKDVYATLDNRTAANFIAGFGIRPAASGVGNFAVFAGISALSGESKYINWHDLMWRAPDNTQVTVEFSGNAANVNQDIYASIYVEG